MRVTNVFRRGHDTEKLRVIVKRYNGDEESRVFDGVALVKKGEILNINFDINVLFTEKSKLGKFCHYSLEFRDTKD
jgi:hypothetical protein